MEIKLKLKDTITLRQSMEIEKLYKKGDLESMLGIVKFIAETEDGSDFDPLDLSEDMLYEILGNYIVKKNKSMKNFMDKIKV